MLHDLTLGVASTAPPPGWVPKDALTVLLTTESLLFAAFGISITLAQETDEGRHPFVAKGRLAIVIALIITCVATGAATAWWDVFSPKWPTTWREEVQAGGIGAGIIGQPMLAWFIVWLGR